MVEAAAREILRRYEATTVRLELDADFDLLGLDSLDLIELVGLAEEVSGQVVANEVLGELRTFRQLLAVLYPTENITQLDLG
jgi:acyl carrier protein